MRLKVYADIQRIRNLLRKEVTMGESLYHSRIGEHSEFMVYEEYTFANSNRMSISIVLEEIEDHTIIHFVTSGSAQGLFFKFDWGSANRRVNRLQTALDRNNIQYTILAN